MIQWMGSTVEWRGRREKKICELEYRAIVIAQFAQYRENRMGWGGGMNRALVIYGPTAKI